MERKLWVWGKMPPTATDKPEYALLLKEMGYTIEGNKLNLLLEIILQQSRLHSE